MKMQKHRNIIKKRGECCPDMTLKTILQAFGVSKISGRFEVVLVTRDQSRGERAEKKKTKIGCEGLAYQGKAANKNNTV